MPSILIFAPHNDDHALAMGGTIATYRKRGYDVITIIASFGEKSHPHLKPEIIRKARVKEAQRADRIYGGNGQVIFLGMREFKFAEDFERKGLAKQLTKRLKEVKPEKVFLPGSNDLHGDHKAFTKLLLPLLKQTEVYTYYVYPNVRHPVAPQLIVDVSGTYRTKLEALRAFRSQISLFSHTVTNNLLYLFILFRDAFTGFMNGMRFAETFYRVR